MNENHTAILEYLNGLKSLSSGCNRMDEGYNYGSVYDFALDRGTFFDSVHQSPDSKPLWKDAKRVVSAASRHRKFELKQCFYNSQMLVLSDPSGELEYAEGWAYSGLIPVHHGWVLFRGAVVDVTWLDRQGRSRIGVPHEDLVYFGTVFSRDLIRSRITNTGWAVSVIDDYKDGWPVLKWPRISAPS